MRSVGGKDEHDYELAAAAHGEATLAGDDKKANQSYSDIIRHLSNLRKQEDDGEASLFSLSKSENRSVACWASTHLLTTNEAEAILRLEELTEIDSGPVGFDAEMVLKEWRAGRLKLP